MLQEDSNGEASFEIIDKKNDDALNSDRTESISSVSSPYSIPSPSLIPRAPSGSLLSNQPAPTNLGDITFHINTSSTATSPLPAPTPLPANLLPPSRPPASVLPPTQPVNVQPQGLPQNFPPTAPQFSAAIPPSKGIPLGPIPPQASIDSSGDLSGGLIGWMKDAVAQGGILSKVAEKAKSSMGSLITTLDPQMNEVIYSGGDIVINVASEEPEELGPVREAIYAVLGKAWVNGISAKVDDKKHFAVGYEEGIQRAEEKINAAIKTQNKPTIAIENILLKQNDEWFDLSVLVLRDSENKINIKTYTQTTPIPLDKFLKQIEKEMPGYARGCDSQEKLLSAYLRILNNDWQEQYAVSRRDTIYLATKTLISIYKSHIDV